MQTTKSNKRRIWIVAALAGLCLWLVAEAWGGNTATWVKLDTTTQGSWHDGTGNNRVYGGDGYWLFNYTGGMSLPSYASATVSGQGTAARARRAEAR